MTEQETYALGYKEGQKARPNVPIPYPLNIPPSNRAAFQVGFRDGQKKRKVFLKKI